jgi:hypothetical protein
MFGNQLLDIQLSNKTLKKIEVKPNYFRYLKKGQKKTISATRIKRQLIEEVFPIDWMNEEADEENDLNPNLIHDQLQQ